MAAVIDTVWAIDLGNSSLKALRLSTAGGVVEVIGFDNIQHGKILSGSGVKATERDELTAISLRQFVQRNDLGNDEIIISVPSQNSFARFVKLPPVEPKRIPEIVKFEAVQQIPFDINDVQWDWQLMTEADSPEKRVGIFAIKNEVVNSALEHFSRENLTVSYVQMAPMALYNYVLYDYADLVTPASDKQGQAVIILNVGAENTDLVVCTKSTVWQRCILIGGNAFTRAIADAFKLNFEKAEKLKRTAPVSKYARQILQAMKPVFTDLVSEVQRSLGFYNSSNPNTKFTRVIALGGGTKLRGLLKYLQQILQIPVERPDTFKRLAIASGVSAAKFHENVCDFGVVYGLALQGLGMSEITSNLLPRSIARSMAWASKSKYFVGAACLLLLVALMCLARTGLDRINYASARNSEIRQQISQVLNDARQASDELAAQKRRGSESEAIIKKQFEPFKYREIVPLMHETILSALPNVENNTAQKELYESFDNGDVEAVLRTPRKERKQLFITGLSVYFSDDLARAQFGATAMMRRGRMGYGEEEYDEYGEEYEMMMEEMEMMGMEGVAPISEYALDYGLGVGQVVVEKKSGFVVTIVGYSPYKNIGELLDPAGVEDRRDKWGLVTRLLHLDDIVDGNSPFELYERTSAEHFRLDKGPVDLTAEMPAGIGVIDVISEVVGATQPGGATSTGGRQILIDPMTKELISKVPELDEYSQAKLDRKGRTIYEINDYWFVLNVKFVWRGAPPPPEPAFPPMTPYGYPRPSVPAPTTPGASGVGAGQFDY